MYMLAKRCQQNLKAPNALEQSIKSYLAAINSLSLLSQDKQWLSVALEVSLINRVKGSIIEVTKLHVVFIE
jgi:hypothetical protein